MLYKHNTLLTHSAPLYASQQLQEEEASVHLPGEASRLRLWSFLQRWQLLVWASVSACGLSGRGCAGFPRQFCSPAWLPRGYQSGHRGWRWWWRCPSVREGKTLLSHWSDTIINQEQLHPSVESEISLSIFLYHTFSRRYLERLLSRQKSFVVLKLKYMWNCLGCRTILQSSRETVKLLRNTFCS